MYAHPPSWPFIPLTEQSNEERARWWENCYVPGIESTIGELTGWRIISGIQGSGKSIALSALERRLQGSALLIPYPPERWVGGAQCLLPQENHFAQIMACAALRVRDYVLANPEKTSSLTELDCEFVYWMIEKFLGRNVHRFWLNKLEPALKNKFSRPPSDDFFPSTTDPLDIEGQMDELATLARRFSYTRVLVSSDLDRNSLPQQSSSTLKNLVAQAEIIQHPGFTILIALPTEMLEEIQPANLGRGRISLYRLKWESQKTREIARLHLQNAGGENPITLERLWDAIGFKWVENWLKEEFGDQPVPLGWVRLTETVYSLVKDGLLSCPVLESEIPLLQKAFYARHQHIELDERAHGVWRGSRFFHLSEQQFSFLTVLCHNRGKPLNVEHASLKAVTMSKTNLHKLASRTRAVIEPFPDEPIYLMNDRAEGGYWLEHLK